VAKHLAEHKIKRAVLITDGYVGEPHGSNADILKAARIGVALTPGESTRNDLQDIARFWTELTD